MDRGQESEVREVFRKHIQAAIDELVASSDIEFGWWPPGVDGRLAEVVLQAVALASEASKLGEEFAAQ